MSGSLAGAGRVPHRGARELGARQHVGAAVLHALELPDRPAELHAHLRVLGRGVDAPLRDADRLGREQHRGEVADPLGGEARRAGGRPAPRTPSRSSCATRRVRSMLGSSVARDVAASSAYHVAVDLAHDHVGVVRRRAPGARRSSATAPVQLAGRELRQPARRPPGRRRSSRIAAAIAVGEVRARARTRGRAPRPRRPARRARSPRRRAPRRRAARASPARAARPRTRAGPRSRRRPRRAPRPGGMFVVDEAPDGLAQLLVLFGDPDRHDRDGRRN